MNKGGQKQAFATDLLFGDRAPEANEGNNPTASGVDLAALTSGRDGDQPSPVQDLLNKNSAFAEALRSALPQPNPESGDSLSSEETEPEQPAQNLADLPQESLYSRLQAEEEKSTAEEIARVRTELAALAQQSNNTPSEVTTAVANDTLNQHQTSPNANEGKGQLSYLTQLLAAAAANARSSESWKAMANAGRGKQRKSLGQAMHTKAIVGVENTKAVHDTYDNHEKGQANFGG